MECKMRRVQPRQRSPHSIDCGAIEGEFADDETQDGQAGRYAES